jgi:hypothetical protein
MMPQKWEEYWSKVDVVDNASNIITDKELAKIERNAKIYAIGNMTLLNSSLNTAVRNYEFSRKMEGEGKKRGIRHYADLGITRFDILDVYDNGDKVWNEKKITDRTLSLAKDIMSIW